MKRILFSEIFRNLKMRPDLAKKLKIIAAVDIVTLVITFCLAIFKQSFKKFPPRLQLVA